MDPGDCHDMDHHLLGDIEYDEAMDGPDCRQYRKRRRRNVPDMFFYHERFSQRGVTIKGIVHQTNKAYLLETDQNKRFWVPKSLINKFFSEDPNRWKVWRNFCITYVD
jgi:hypothetical protein